MPTSRYLLLVVTAFCGLMVLAAANAWVQADTPTRQGFYTCSYIRTKIAKGSQVGSPKLVIISGSNALSGIDTRALARTLKVNAFNFGLSASFGPGFQAFEAAKILRPGDAVLMPFEYLAYDYATPRSSLVDAVYSCGSDYWRSLDWKEKLFFVLAVRPQRMIDSHLFRARPQSMQQVAMQAAQDVDAFGQRPGEDFHDPQTAAEIAGSGPLAIHMDSSSPGAAAIANFVAWARAHHITVFATWPNTLAFPQYRGSPAFADIRAFYSGLGVDVVGKPEAAMFPAAEMSDTIYHLNYAGRETRTARLADALRADPVFERWQHGHPYVSAPEPSGVTTPGIPARRPAPSRERKAGLSVAPN